MHILLDIKDNSLYATVNRNGSTLLSEISERNRTCKIIQIETMIQHLEVRPETPIYCPFRNPLVRFKSGLAVNLHNRTMFKDNNPTDEALEKSYRHFETIVNYFDITFGTMENVIGSSYHRPYHLFDQHIDHWLSLPLTMCVYGYNVQPIKMNEFSEHLKTKFDNVNDLIEKRQRPDSYDKSTPQQERLFSIYKSVFVDKKPEFENRISLNLRKTFDQWMAPELEIFNFFHNNYKTANINHVAHNIVKKFFDQKIYFNDPYSVNHSSVIRLTKLIHKYRNTNPRFKFMIDNYKLIEDGLNKTLGFNYVEPTDAL